MTNIMVGDTVVALYSPEMPLEYVHRYTARRNLRKYLLNTQTHLIRAQFNIKNKKKEHPELVIP